jgi:hypothetical protein
VPLANYTELNAAIVDWLLKPALTAKVPDFIRLSEAKLDREIRCRHNQVSLATSMSGNIEPLPADFVDIDGISLTSPTQRRLVYMPPAQMFSLSEAGVIGIPRYATIIGDNIHLVPISQSAVAYKMTYFKSIPNLSVAAPTNWLLTVAPDIYLFSSLCEAEPYLKNDARLAMWKARRDEAVASLNSADSVMRSNWSGKAA